MVIGFHGRMGSGKDTAAERLAQLSSIPVQRVAFADKLKESAAALLDISVETLERLKNDPAAAVVLYPGDDERDPAAGVGMSVREFLQRYGTESHRDVFGQDFWLDEALPIPSTWLGSEASGYYSAKTLYVVTDVRFPNEKQRIEDLGGLVLRVIGPDEEISSHVSEQELDCGLVIDNRIRDDDFSALDEQLRKLLYLLDADRTGAYL